MDLLRFWRLDRPARRSEGAPPAAVQAYVAAWIVGGAVLVALLARLDVAVTAAPLTIGLLVLGVVVADSISVTIQHPRNTESVTVIDVVVAMTILMVAPAVAMLVVLLGVTLNHLFIKRIAPVKVAFNATQHAVAAGLAGLVLVPVDDRSGAFTLELLGFAGLALVVYFVVGGLGMAGIFRLFGDRHALRSFFARTPFLGVTVFGNGVAGLLAYGLLQTNPVLLPLLVSPIIAMQLAYRGAARSEMLLGEVRIERDRLDRVIAGASEGIVLLDADGRVRVWNPAMEAITGRSADDSVGRPASEVLAGEDPDGVPVDPAMPVERNEHGAYEISLTSVTGVSDPPVVQMTHTVITDQGAVIGDVILVRDLSRERAARSLKEDFVARVSHELRTPLSPIRGYAQVLLAKGDLVPPQQRTLVLERIVERVGHLERLIEDLLLVSRISSGAVGDLDEVTMERVELGSLVTRLVGWFERDHPERQFEVHVAPDLPAARADAFRVGQIVTNLLSNACKYSPGGSPVELRLASRDGRVQIDVTDHGVGIATDQREAVFDRFQRLEDPQRMRTGGIGLGLYISRHLAERMGGSLGVTSRLGAGSTFTLALEPDDGTAPAVARRATVRVAAATGAR